VFEVSARWLPVVLFVLAIAGANAFAANDASNSFMAVEPETEGVLPACFSGGLEATEGTRFLASNPRDNSPVSFPASISSRSLGVLGISLASGHFLWLMLAACLLSYGQYWQATWARLRCSDVAQQDSQPPALSEDSIVDSQISTCMYVCQQATRKMSDESDPDHARALVGLALVLEMSGSRPALILSPSLPSLSPLVSAQLGRGPPRAS
jgi:hypothetical protein